MDAVTAVKKRIATLADTNRRLTEGLAEGQRRVIGLERERDDLSRQLEHAGQESSVLLHEHEALIRDLDASRRQLMGDLGDSKRKLDQAEARLETSEQERHEVVAELDEATTAFLDIREQLQSSIEEMKGT